MDLSNLSGALDQSKENNSNTQQFLNGLLTLARHWNGQEGVNEIHSRITEATLDGIPVQEALIESYHYVKSKIF